jgi:hypothetical protein
MRMRKRKSFGCRVKGLEVATRQPNNRSRVALESEDLHFDQLLAAT